MASRAIGAAFALLAALAFVTAFAGGAAPKLVPGWWDGHPRIEGRVFERKDLHVGLVSAYGCNRGETIKCQPLTTETLRVSIGYVELLVLALIAVTAAALGRSTWKIGDRRKRLGKALLIQAGIAALGGAIVLALGPQIKVAQRFEAPIGMGMFALWGGVAFALIAAVIAIRLKPEPLRLRSSQAHNIPARPMPAAAREPLGAAIRPPVEAATVPPVKAAPTRPPPIPGLQSGVPPVPGSRIETNHSNAGVTLAIRGPSNATGPAPLAAPAIPVPGDTETTAGPFGQGTVPPPLSAISFWSAPPIGQGPAVQAVAPPPLAPPPLPALGASPAPVAPPPLPALGASPASVAPPPLPTGAGPTLPPPIPSLGASAPSAPRSMPPSLPTLIHAVPPPPSAAGEVLPPDAPGAADDPTKLTETVAPSVASTDAPTDPAHQASAEPRSEDSVTATIGAPTQDAATAPPSVEATAPAAPDPASPQIDVPISTAPASLPPPKKVAAADSELAAACPQCEAAMAWVDEHLRFYCGECRMYF